MSWYLRAVEQADGSWLPRFGLTDFPVQPDETTLLAFLVAAATALGGREMFRFYLHRIDGTIETRAAADPVPGEAAI